MAGLNLMNAVRGYQQGVQFSQQQEQVERAKQQQAVMDEADKAAGGVVSASQAEWAATGAQGTYQASDTTMLKAAQARGQTLAKGGDWNGFLKNEATVQNQRIRVRAGALQKYEQDGDFEALARTAYPTVFDGKEIVGTERLGGMPALDSIGRPGSPTKYKIKLSDGTTQEVSPEDEVKKLKLSLIDPVKSAEREIETNFLRTKAQIEAEAKAMVEREKGNEARKTEDLKTDRQIKVEGVKADRALSLANVNNASDEKRTGISANATLGAARIGKEGRVEAAGITAGGKGGKDPAAAERKTFKDLHTEVIRTLGPQSGALGGGRMGNARTLGIAKGVEKAIAAGASEADAIEEATRQYDARFKVDDDGKVTPIVGKAAK